eukprot:COSAG02_NODE_428_length_22489_cov_4.690219_19_plen_159_part_00
MLPREPSRRQPVAIYRCVQMNTSVHALPVLVLSCIRGLYEPDTAMDIRRNLDEVLSILTVAPRARQKPLPLDVRTHPHRHHGVRSAGARLSARSCSWNLRTQKPSAQQSRFTIASISLSWQMNVYGSSVWQQSIGPSSSAVSSEKLRSTYLQRRRSTV